MNNAEKEKSGEDVYNHVLEEFVKWLPNQKHLTKQKSPPKCSDTVYRDAYRLCRYSVAEAFANALNNNDNKLKPSQKQLLQALTPYDISRPCSIELLRGQLLQVFADALNDNDGENRVYNFMELFFTLNPQKTKTSSQSAYESKNQFIYLKNFLKERPDLLSEVLIAARYLKDKRKTRKKQKSSVKKDEKQSKSNLMPAKSINKPLSDEPDKIVERIIDRIEEINQIYKNLNKHLIFQDSVYKLSRIIKKLCTSEGQFINFTLKLYIMIYETTREENSNDYTKGKPIFYLPEEFYKNGTSTKHFMVIVGTLRHHYAHFEPEYKEQIKKISWGDVLNELLGNRNEPKSKEDFQKLQIEVLKRFETSMDKLLEIVKNELNPDKG
jgi:hypothetical protein